MKNMLKSDFVSIDSAEIDSQKLGHPVPESNLVSELKSGLPQQMQVIGALLFTVMVFSCESTFCPFLPSHLEFFCAELCFPLFFRLDKLFQHPFFTPLVNVTVNLLKKTVS